MVNSEDPSIDVCIVCALAEEAQAFLAVVPEQQPTAWAAQVSPRYRYDYRCATIHNNRGETLTLHVSWLPRYGPQEMTLHLSHVLEEYQPRFAAMMGICAGDKRRVVLGDLVVAERTFAYDTGRFEHDEEGRCVHQHDTLTHQPDENILRFVHLFDQWKPFVAQLLRPPSKRQQRDWLLNQLLQEHVPSIDRIPPAELEHSAPAWRRIIHELQQEPHPLLTASLVLQEKGRVERLRYGVDPFPYTDPGEARCVLKPMASGSAVRSDDPFTDIQVPVRGAVAIDMEGAAFGRTMASFPRTGWLVVKGVSDYADSDKDDSYHHCASFASAHYLLCFMKEYVTNERLPPFSDQHRRDDSLRYRVDALGQEQVRQGEQFADLQQHVLRQSGSHPQAMIDRLRRHTRHTLDWLAPGAAIVAGSTRLKITRRCAEAIRAAAEHGSLVVTGLPGIGKSVALSDVVNMLLTEGRDVVFLTTEEADSGALTVQNVVDALEHWQGSAPAFLVIDALDSTRFGQSDHVLRTVLARVARAGTRWHVIAAMRTFDLTYDDEIRRIFAGTPPNSAFQEITLDDLRHLAIASFTEEELDQARTQSAPLARLLGEASPQLRALLVNPFNLRLAGELLQEGVSHQEFRLLRTQVQLLDRYWAHSITRPDGLRTAREFILRTASEEMLAARTLRIDRARLSDPAASQALDQLLCSHLLVAWQDDALTSPDDSLLTFSHRILFDYAITRLLLSGSTENLVRRLEQTHELALVIRPSVVYRFQQFWLQSNQAGCATFWRAILQVQRGQHIPRIGKLIGPSVAAAFATTFSELDPLLAAMASADDLERGAGEAVLRHLIGALVAEQEHLLIGETAGPWCELLERLSRSANLPVLLSTRVLLSRLVEQPESLTDEQCRFAGEAARRLLAHAWEAPEWDPVPVRFLLAAVCRTFESNPVASRALVRRCLEPGHLAAHGDQELFALTEEIPRLVTRDPELVADLYAAAFSYEETSEEITHIGRSQLLSLRSTRRQDYETVLYRLAEHYPAFLREAPLVAVHALIAALDGHHPLPQEEISSFDFLNVRASILVRCDPTLLSRDMHKWPEPLGKMLSTFSIYLARVAENPQCAEELLAVLSLLGEANRHGILWRRVLLEGAKAPTTLGSALRQLTWALPVISSTEMTEAMGDLLASLFADLAIAERERVERTVLALPGVFPQGRQAMGEYIRDRLVRRLPLHALVTDEVRTLATALASTGEDREQMFPETAWWSNESEATTQGPFGEAQQAVRVFLQTHWQAAPTREECEGVLPHLRSLFTQLAAHAVEESSEATQALSAWRDLSEACMRIAGCNEVTCSSDLGVFVYATLLTAASHPWPIATPAGDEAFDTSPAYGGDPRECAAIGLTWLARHQDGTPSAVLEAVIRLSADPVASVRYLIAYHARNLSRTVPETMWQVLEDRIHHDPSHGVLQGVLDSLRALSRRDPDRTSDLAQVIYERTPAGAGAIQVRKGCAELFAGLYLYRNHAPSGARTFALIEQPERAVDEVWQVLAAARETLTYGPLEPPQEKDDAVRQRGWDVLQRAVGSIQEALQRAQSSSGEERRGRLLALYRLADAIGSDLYHASGAAHANAHPEQDRSLAEKRRFFREAESLFDELSAFGLPALGHALAQTLAFLVPADPARVFLLFAQVILRVADRGYSYEPAGVNLLIRVVERYLAEYRDVLQQDATALQLIIQVLDSFIEAGWPAAWHLVYRLDQLFF